MPEPDILEEAARLLGEALESGEPIFANDETLARLAHGAAEELRLRYPRYALTQGDIDDEELVEIREAAAAATDKLR